MTRKEIKTAINVSGLRIEKRKKINLRIVVTYTGVLKKERAPSTIKIHRLFVLT